MSLIERAVRTEPAALASIRNAFEKAVPWVPYENPDERVVAGRDRLTRWNRVKEVFVAEVITTGNFQFDPRELVERTLQASRETS